MHPRPNTIESVDSDEELLADMHKHPIGIIFLYIQVFVGVIAAVGLSLFLLPSVFEDNSRAFALGNLVTVVVVLLAFMVCLIATYIYRENRLVVTDRNITQTLQYGLFTRKVSQLNINNVEDVTALQDGFFPTFFNYGTLKVETAGEQVNFHFTFCPNVGYYAKIILEAREHMLGQNDDPPSTMTKKTTSTTVIDSSPENSVSQTQAIKELGAETLKQASNDQNT